MAKKKLTSTRGKRRVAPGMKKHSSRVTASSKDHTWRTPRSFLDLVEKVIGRIKLDPCADRLASRQFAKHNYTGRGSDNGLALGWRNYGAVFVNPPYGRGLPKWIEKTVHEFSKDIEEVGINNDELILLVPARPDTRWFQDTLLPAANGFCFWKGRLKFSGSDPAPFPSLVCYFGLHPEKFLKVFGSLGWTVTS